MSEQATQEQRPSSMKLALKGAWIGTCAGLGWLLHDALVFVTSGQASVFAALIPGSLMALLVAAELGVLAGRFKFLAPLYVIAGFAAKWAPMEVHELLPLAPRGPVFTAYLGAAVCAFGIVLILSWLGKRLLNLSEPRTAACLGFVAAIAVGYFGQKELTPYWLLLGGGALAALALGSPKLPLRHLITAAVVLGPVLWACKQGLPESSASYWRDDLPPPVTGPGDGPNLLLVVLDTLRAESLTPYGHDRETTPQIDAWVNEHATVFTQSRSTSSFTLATHGSLFTGTLPAQHKAARLRPASLPLDEQFPTIAERLREQRYQTGAIVSNFTYLNPKYDMDRGFEHFDYRKGAFTGRYLALAQMTGKTAWAGKVPFRDAHSITGSALAWIDRRREDVPFFLMLNYLDAHTPYIPRAPHDTLFEDELFPNPFGVPQEHRELAYERNVHYLDEQVGVLLEGIESRGLMDNTVVVITSDHGEAFGEHGLQEHCWTLYDDVVRVPLYIKPADGRRSERDDRSINSAELTWLMLDELGVRYDPPPPMDGLIAEWYRQVPMTDKYLAMAERVEMDLDRDLVAWIEDGRKTIVSTRREVQAFDLAADPDEQSPLELSQDEIDQAVVRAMKWWDAHPMAAEQTEEIPPEEMARLRALGYVGQEEDE